MLVLADRKFLSWALAREFLATGAHILWRASASFTLKPVKILADGTYLAELTPPRKSDGAPLTVRVIEYTVHTTADDGGDEETSELFCLVTDLLDPEEYPALDLACCYPRRWGCEIGHRWYRSSCAAFSWLRSFVVAGFRFGRCPAGAGVEAWRACPALA